MLLKGIRDKKYKYTYTKEDVSEEDLMQLIENKKMDIPAQCFSRMNDSIFGKIRSGLTEEKSPPPAKQQRRRKTSN